MPGTLWEKQDFDYVQANKHKLQDAGAGVYGGDQFKQIGFSIESLKNLAPARCKTKVLKMRRLIPDQAAYRLLGETQSEQGKDFSRAYFVDEKNIIRGFAVPVEPNKNIVKGLFEEEPWAGFVNLDKSTIQNRITLYAYNNKQICEGDKLELPEYIKPTKKRRENGQ
jgi:hypothetical protein